MQMTVVFASAGFQRVLGFESERLLGKDFVAVRPFFPVVSVYSGMCGLERVPCVSSGV